MLDGRMRFRVAGRPVTVGPGEMLTVPPSTVHHFANAGPGTARVAVETRPALAMETMLRTAAALAQEQHAAGRRLGGSQTTGQLGALASPCSGLRFLALPMPPPRS